MCYNLFSDFNSMTQYSSKIFSKKHITMKSCKTCNFLAIVFVLYVYLAYLVIVSDLPQIYSPENTPTSICTICIANLTLESFWNG